MKLGLIGCGKMGSALLKGIIGSCENVEACWVFDAYAPAMQALVDDPDLANVHSADSNQALAEAADVVLLCVKPNTLDAVCREIASVEEATLCVSIAAGVTLTTIEGCIGSQHRVVRVMPNTPALVGAGASGYTLGQAATPEDGELTKCLLQAVGVAHEVPETLLDAVTGLSGSGPAYIYLVIEALADAGVLNGLPRDTAVQLSAQTVLGAARMVLETGEHPGVLKDQVTSPGGTTIRGLGALEKEGLRNALIEAVNAATERSRELAAPGK